MRSLSLEPHCPASKPRRGAKVPPPLDFPLCSGLVMRQGEWWMLDRRDPVGRAVHSVVRDGLPGDQCHQRQARGGGDDNRHHKRKEKLRTNRLLQPRMVESTVSVVKIRTFIVENCGVLHSRLLSS